ncbi:MAG: branched-chain amino acid aminotransferase [Rikenellaceae bacterium]
MTNLDWKSLNFAYTRTPYNVRTYFRNGAWGQIETHSEESINIHMAATALHYGQEAFEGLKAFTRADGKVSVFRMEENAKRLIRSAERLKMAAPSIELFCDCVEKVVSLNKEFVPPYGTGASLYIRPLLVGTGPQVGVSPAEEYLLLMFVTPVGPYYKTGTGTMKAAILRDYDRAAPHGTGHIKAGGNYGASLDSFEVAHDKGYQGILYLDPKEKKYIDELGAANFFGIKGNSYITPSSSSILNSITNMSLRDLAADMGMSVEARQVELSEIETFDEIGACGTAAVITPIERIDDLDLGKSYCFDNKMGPKTKALYDRLINIQLGVEEDKFGWNREIK